MQKLKLIVFLFFILGFLIMDYYTMETSLQPIYPHLGIILAIVLIRLLYQVRLIETSKDDFILQRQKADNN